MLGVMDDQATPPCFEFHLNAHPGDAVRTAFPELHVRNHGQETVLAGALPDQAALHGVLARIEALGLVLLEIRRVRGEYPPPADRSRSSGTGDGPPGRTLAVGSTGGRPTVTTSVSGRPSRGGESEAATRVSGAAEPFEPTTGRTDGSHASSRGSRAAATAATDADRPSRAEDAAASDELSRY